ncbi:MAG: hypothetical protein BWX86_02139 [Verrucomicrobia bacterium ADurb.Bin122]|nr:MAG: hypothetical protein BWX86_02139 [Verrucomicrobia bacterium ADurb.Bin122]
MSAIFTPACACTKPDSASISNLSSGHRWSTHPPRNGAAEPVSVVPAPRTVTGTRWRLASASTAAMSASLRGNTTASGENRILLLSKPAAYSDCASVRTTLAPKRRRSVCVAVRYFMDELTAT